MKRKSFGFFVVIFFLALFTSCATAQKGDTISKDAPPLIVRTGVYEGLVSVDGQAVYLITNYKSRSRVDYLVTGDLKDKITVLDGQVITVIGTAKRRGWSGTIEVTEILKPKQSKNPSGEKEPNTPSSDTKN